MIQLIFRGRNRGYLDWGENGEIPYDPIYLTSRTYMSTQDASSSPGLRKGTFGTPIGIK